MSTSVGVVIDCAQPQRLAEFWTAALGYVIEPPPAGYADWAAYDAAHGISPEEAAAGCKILDPDGSGPTIFFQRVPEAKVVKNRVHLDVKVSRVARADITDPHARIEAAVAPLVALGARVVRRSNDPHDDFIVLLDPEGNEFCLV